MPPIFVDTGFAIALLNLGDPFHASALSWHRAVRRRRWPLVITTAVLIEIGNGFSKKGLWHLVTQFLQDIVHDPLVEIVSVDLALVRRAITFRQQRADKDWSITDCISFLVMDDRGLRDALTADQDFVQAGFRALLREPPVIH